MIFRILKVSITLLLILVISSVVVAQDENDQELIDRVLASSESIDSYESFVVNLTVAGDQVTAATFGEQSLEQTTTFTSEYEVTVIRGDNPIAYGTTTAVVDYNDQTTAFSYVIEAEIRYVDGVLFVNGAYTEGGEGLPALPEGWVIVEDPQTDLNYGALELDRIVNWAVVEDEEESEDELERILATATSLEVTEEEIDGTPVETISATFGWAGVMDILAEGSDGATEDPLFAMIGEQLADADELMTVSVTLDDEDNFRIGRIGFLIEVTDLAGEALGIPDGSVSILLSNSEETVYSQINESFDPVEAPEIETAG